MSPTGNRMCAEEESDRLTQQGWHGETGRVLNVFDLFCVMELASVATNPAVAPAGELIPTKGMKSVAHLLNEYMLSTN